MKNALYTRQSFQPSLLQTTQNARSGKLIPWLCRARNPQSPLTRPNFSPFSINLNTFFHELLDHNGIFDLFSQSPLVWSFFHKSKRKEKNNFNRFVLDLGVYRHVFNVCQAARERCIDVWLYVWRDGPVLTDLFPPCSKVEQYAWFILDPWRRCFYQSMTQIRSNQNNKANATPKSANALQIERIRYQTPKNMYKRISHLLYGFFEYTHIWNHCACERLFRALNIVIINPLISFKFGWVEDFHFDLIHCQSSYLSLSEALYALASFCCPVQWRFKVNNINNHQSCIMWGKIQGMKNNSLVRCTLHCPNKAPKFLNRLLCTGRAPNWYSQTVAIDFMVYGYCLLATYYMFYISIPAKLSMNESHLRLMQNMALTGMKIETVKVFAGINLFTNLTFFYSNYNYLYQLWYKHHKMVTWYHYNKTCVALYRIVWKLFVGINLFNVMQLCFMITGLTKEEKIEWGSKICISQFYCFQVMGDKASLMIANEAAYFILFVQAQGNKFPRKYICQCLEHFQDGRYWPKNRVNVTIRNNFGTKRTKTECTNVDAKSDFFSFWLVQCCAQMLYKLRKQDNWSTGSNKNCLKGSSIHKTNKVLETISLLTVLTPRLE